MTVAATISAGDTAWVFVASALVLLMIAVALLAFSMRTDIT